jgi:hypothetical protein
MRGNEISQALKAAEYFIKGKEMRLTGVSSILTALSLSTAIAADAPSWPQGTCVYRDLHYTNGTVICIAPHFGQICNKDGVWDVPNNARPLQELCETAQIPTNPSPSTPSPAAMCTYHGVQYSVGSTICVAPHLAQRCELRIGTESRSVKEVVQWSFVDHSPDSDLFFKWCENAQIPNPAAPPPQSGK